MTNYYSISHNTNAILSQIFKRFIFPLVFFIIGVLPQQTKAYNTVQGNTNSKSISISNNNGPVTVYKDCGFGGLGIDLQVGDYTLSDLMALGIKDNDISSIDIQFGYQIILYKQDNFMGEILNINFFNSGCLTDVAFDNMTSSLKIIFLPNPLCANTNGDFNIGSTNWDIWPSTTTYSTAAGELVITSASTGPWDIQASTFYNFVANKSYILTFDALSSVQKDIVVMIRDNYAPVSGLQYVKTITPTLTKYQVSFQYPTTAAVKGELLFVVGGGNGITIDNVCISEPNMCKGNCEPPMSTNEYFKSKFNVSPIPASNVLEINADNIKYDMSIYSIEGKLLLKQTNLSNSNTIDIASLSNGVYILKISNGDMVMNKKIIVSK